MPRSTATWINKIISIRNSLGSKKRNSLGIQEHYGRMIAVEKKKVNTQIHQAKEAPQISSYKHHS
jgi:hypothetical protein